MARPTVMTDEVLDKLRQAFLIGATNEEAYRYAGVSHETFYNYLEKHPEFREKMEAWKEEPILKAKRKVVTDIDKDTKTAQWYLERKAKDFKSKVDITSGDEPISEIKVRFVGEDDEPVN